MPVQLQLLAQESTPPPHLELLFFTVLALPNASSTGLDYARSTCRNEEVSAGAVIKEERGGGGNGEFFFPYL